MPDDEEPQFEEVTVPPPRTVRIKKRRGQGERQREKQMTRKGAHGERVRNKSDKSIKHIADIVEVRKRQERALELRLGGATLANIAQQLKYANASGAKYAIDRAIERIGYEPAEDLVHLELRRLDRMQQICWVNLLQGDTTQINNLLRIMEMRARYVGVDAFLTNKTAEINIQMGKDGKVEYKDAKGVMVIYGEDEDSYVKQLAAAMGVTPEQLKTMLPNENSSPQAIKTIKGATQEDMDIIDVEAVEDDGTDSTTDLPVGDAAAVPTGGDVAGPAESQDDASFGGPGPLDTGTSEGTVAGQQVPELDVELDAKVARSNPFKVKDQP